jgi:hypothetical protein
MKNRKTMNVPAAVTAEDTTMADPQVYLEKLSAFSRMLQLEGLAVSPKETGDAAQMLIVTGFDFYRAVSEIL